MNQFKRNYIIIGALRGYISGAPIYYRNKAIYMQSQGWNVYCVSTSEGQVYIDGLEQFVVGAFPELVQKTYYLSSKRLNEILNKVIDCIPNAEYETVIETGTYFITYWGEMLAQKLRARHIIVYLDEHNDGIHKQQADFFKFKYEREELACISDGAYRDIFSQFWEYHKDKSYTLPCFCTNSLEDIDSPIVDNVIKADYTVGYIGRLEKDAFKDLVKGLCEFADSYPKATIALNCFGGYQCSEAEVKLRERLLAFSNVQLYVSGILFPIPQKAVEKCDLNFASAGSVRVSVMANVPTISMNVYSRLPDGFRVGVRDKRSVSCPNCSSVFDYLKVFFIDGYRPQMSTYDLSEDTLAFDECFSKHLTFLHRAMNRKKEYYDTSIMKMTLKERIFYLDFISNHKVYPVLKFMHKHFKTILKVWKTIFGKY